MLIVHHKDLSTQNTTGKSYFIWREMVSRSIFTHTAHKWRVVRVSLYLLNHCLLRCDGLYGSLTSSFGTMHPGMSSKHFWPRTKWGGCSWSDSITAHMLITKYTFICHSVAQTLHIHNSRGKFSPEQCQLTFFPTFPLGKVLTETNPYFYTGFKIKSLLLKEHAS